MSDSSAMREDAAAVADDINAATPGARLKEARIAQGLSERAVAQQLKWIPDYVEVLERDDYQALRQPRLARCYVQSYGRLLNLDEATLLGEFDALRGSGDDDSRRDMSVQALHLQRTGLGVVIGLGVLLMMVVALWWRGGGPERGV